LRRSPSTPDQESECRGYPTCYTPFTTAELHGSKDAFDILNNICTPASLLFDPRFTSRQRPSALPPFRTFPPSPPAQRIPYSVPSTISVQNLDTGEPAAEMDKRHPSSFQQLEKLGEGTYATVRGGRQYLVYCRIILIPPVSFVAYPLQAQQTNPVPSVPDDTIVCHLSDSFRSSKDETGKLGNW
jgi:hypothetical protein